jgi:hypothetical protein
MTNPEVRNGCSGVPSQPLNTGIGACAGALCGSLVFLVRAARYDLDRVVGQRSLQRLGLIPRRAHPDVALLIGQQDYWHGLGMDRLDHGIWRCGEVDLMRAGNRFRFVPRSPLKSVQMPAKHVSGRSSLIANQTTSFFSGFGSGAYSAKLLNGTRQRQR